MAEEAAQLGAVAEFLPAGARDPWAAERLAAAE